MLANGEINYRFDPAMPQWTSPGEGAWASPILANGTALRRLNPKLKGPDIALTYVAGCLFLGGTSILAREA